MVFQSDLAAGARGVSFAEAWSRMELEFELARGQSAPVGLVRFAIERFAKLAPERRASVCVALGELVRVRAPREVVVAALREDELVVCLPASDAAETELFARALVTEARKLAIAGADAPVRVDLCAGLAATRPGLDLWFETLDAVAGEGALVARAQGGASCIHSELYELHQRRVERTKGPRTAVPAPAPNAAASAAQNYAPAPTKGRTARGTAHTATATPSAAATARASAHAAPAPSTPEAAALDAHLRAVLPAAGSVPGLDLAAVEAKVLELAKAAFERALAEQARQFQGQLELYERRISKMQTALSETESERDRLARLSPVDTGVASTYREVQGLALDDASSDPRLGMLRAIWESNLELRASLDRKSA